MNIAETIETIKIGEAARDELRVYIEENYLKYYEPSYQLRVEGLVIDDFIMGECAAFYPRLTHGVYNAYNRQFILTKDLLDLDKLKKLAIANRETETQERKEKADKIRQLKDHAKEIGLKDIQITEGFGLLGSY